MSGEASLFEPGCSFVTMIWQELGHLHLGLLSARLLHPGRLMPFAPFLLLLPLAPVDFLRCRASSSSTLPRPPH